MVEDRKNRRLYNDVPPTDTNLDLLSNETPKITQTAKPLQIFTLMDERYEPLLSPAPSTRVRPSSFLEPSSIMTTDPEKKPLNTCLIWFTLILAVVCLVLLLFGSQMLGLHSGPSMPEEEAEILEIFTEEYATYDLATLTAAQLDHL
jgi:hypothetical protein